MIIDIKPKIQKANELEKTIMEMRNISHLYVVKATDGSEFTVKFDQKNFDTFCSSRKVSEMLLNWEEGLISEVELFRKSAKNKQHPYWTKEEIIEEATSYKRAKTMTVPQPITRETAKMFEELAKRKEKLIGQLEFVKIIK
jgi:hypothetical protein